ncbi:Uncharacterized protein K02A2.6 [Stylophora pistillata]|uniref:Uncharacterized protein K02A2.6 n=1 Tax=Stylophora pistillata TaxID=50429 RepID=A0A2B4R6Q3_STYPI|nr:Uncharacterized protein K02A2.6 [Stylophora pistillata]
MTETEKRYSQTEKDALAIKWAKERMRIYLLGAPRFRIVTAHKPLVPLFDKVKAKIPPRIEKWIMEMQDIDYELVYEPGKDEAGPLDFLSKHPLPETGHHGGPYPDGHYNLVLIDKRTRYPVVESVPSTDFQTNKERLKHISATYGTPRRIENDNGLPFNSKEFNEFAKQEGFQHHRATALHPRANGEVERFMQNLNKTEKITNLQGKNGLERRNAVQDMLIAYRSTPHPATGVAPYEALKGTTVRTKLDYTEPKPWSNEKDDIINRRDAEYKQKMKQQREERKTRENNLLLGDYVLIKQPRKNKWSTPYEPVFYIVYNICGSQITARRVTDGRTIYRDASQFKLANAGINTTNETEKSEEVQTPQAVPDLKIPEKETPLSVPPVPPDAMANAEKPKEPTSAEMIPEQPNEPEQGVEHNQPANRPAVTRPRRERCQPHHLKDYVLS